MYFSVLTTSKNRKQNCPSLCSPVSFAAATEIAWCVTRPKNSREEYWVFPSDLVLPLKESLITSQNLHLVQRWCSEIIIFVDVLHASISANSHRFREDNSSYLICHILTRLFWAALFRDIYRTNNPIFIFFWVRTKSFRNLLSDLTSSQQFVWTPK